MFLKKKNLPFLLIILVLVFSFLFLAKFHIKQVTYLQTTNKELSDKLNKIVADIRTCASVEHNCNLIAEDRKTIVASYRKTNGEFTYTYRISALPGWNWAYSSGQYLIMGTPNGNFQGLYITKAGLVHTPERCVFPENFKEEGISNLINSYKNILTDIGSFRLGLTENQETSNSIESLWLCQETHPGSGEWITETGFGIIELKISPSEPDRTIISQSIQIVKNARVTDTEAMY